MEEKGIVSIYVDGTIIKDIAGYAFCVVQNNEIIYESGGVLEGEINKLRNIAGELKAVIEAVNWTKKNNYKCVLIFDLLGSYNWIQDIFEPDKKAWKRNNIYTQKYYQYIKKNKEYIEGFRWQRGHQKGSSQDEVYNNHVDILTRKYHPLSKTYDKHNNNL